MTEFLASINQAYAEFEDDLGRVEHILEQSSNELFKTNRELARIAQEKTEEAATTSRRLEEVVGSISEVLIQMDEAGIITYLNQAWETITGYPVAESLGKKLTQFSLGPSSAEKIACMLSFRGESTKDFFLFPTAGGTDKWLNLSLRRHTSEQAGRAGFIGTLADVTAPYLARLELNRLALVVKKTKNSIVIADADGKITWVNEAFSRLTGYSFEEARGQMPGTFLQGPKTSAEVRKEIGQKLRAKELFHGELINYNKAGQEYWVELLIEPLFDEENNHIGFIAVENDVSARKKQEERINQLVVWINESSEAVQVSDESGTLLFVNQEAARRIGKAPEEITGTHISTIEKIFEQEGTWSAHVQDLKSRSKMIIEGIHKREDGSTFPVEASVKYHESEEGQGYVLAFIRDITERREAEKKLKLYMRDLERINAELDQFAYVVSHDLKAPLRAINNLSEWIEEDISHLLEGDTREQFTLLRGRVHRMENLINGILTYSRAGRIKTNKEYFLVKNVVDELCDIFNTSQAIHFRLEGPQQLQIFSEKITLVQVLQNLVSNGIKYNDKESIEITIGWSEKEEVVEFYVSDNGPGIKPEFHQRIFVIFQTLQSRDELESTGVGLAIVKKIIDEKGGDLRLESTLGEGTTFYFSWPKSEKTETV